MHDRSVTAMFRLPSRDLIADSIESVSLLDHLNKDSDRDNVDALRSYWCDRISIVPCRLSDLQHRRRSITMAISQSRDVTRICLGV